jgi:AraC-like DNA-binding protein
MKDLVFEFEDFDRHDCFEKFGKALGGHTEKETLVLDSDKARGEVVMKVLNEGLAIRKWKFTAFHNTTLRKRAAVKESPQKFILLYILHPTTIHITHQRKKIRINGSRNNLFVTNDVEMEFRLPARAPFYVFDISFTEAWLKEQFTDADPQLKETLQQYINNNQENIIAEQLSVDEYKTLHDLQVSMTADKEDDLFIRARSYNMLCNFFGKLMNRKDTEMIQSGIYYDQIMHAEMMILKDLKNPPRLNWIAREVNMSVSSLLRKFKIIYGKSIYEYYVEKKMKVARHMILEKKLPVKEMARMLGYNQPSAFIESFSRQHGYSPGSLKLLGNDFMFF